MSVDPKESYRNISAKAIQEFDIMISNKTKTCFDHIKMLVDYKKYSQELNDYVSELYFTIQYLTEVNNRQRLFSHVKPFNQELYSYYICESKNCRLKRGNRLSFDTQILTTLSNANGLCCTNVNKRFSQLSSHFVENRKLYQKSENVSKYREVLQTKIFHVGAPHPFFSPFIPIKVHLDLEKEKTTIQLKIVDKERLEQALELLSLSVRQRFSKDDGFETLASPRFLNGTVESQTNFDENCLPPPPESFFCEFIYQAKAKGKFKKQTDDYLNYKKGTIIDVLWEGDGDWSYGKIQDRSGYFLKANVKKIK